MNKGEFISINQYLYNMEERLENAVKDCSIKYK